jgi:hypothetical protein
MTSPRRPSPDDRLAPDNCRQLNRTFYAAKPADYFGQRLENLILTAGRSEDLDRLMTEGATYRGLNVAGHVEGGKTVRTDGRSPEEKAKAAEHFVIAEAEVLSHHVGETLLRLYLAHEFPAGQAPPCPWLEISRLRSFSQFKDIVRRRFGPDSDPDETGLEIAVHHFPPGTSKWTEVEHRLFSAITQNWRGKPLVSHETVVNLIAATTTRTGLRVRSELDTGDYPAGLRVGDAEMATLHLQRDGFHGEWNYALIPRQRLPMTEAVVS